MPRQVLPFRDTGIQPVQPPYAPVDEDEDEERRRRIEEAVGGQRTPLDTGGVAPPPPDPIPYRPPADDRQFPPVPDPTDTNVRHPRLGPEPDPIGRAEPGMGGPPAVGTGPTVPDTLIDPADFATTAARDIARSSLAAPTAPFGPGAAQDAAASTLAAPQQPFGPDAAQSRVNLQPTGMEQVAGATAAQDIAGEPIDVDRQQVAGARAAQNIASEIGTAAAPGDAYRQFQEFASGVLTTPSRWDTDLMRESLGLVDQQIEEEREERLRALDEYHAARGTFGGTPEIYDPNRGRLALEEELSETEAARINDLLREQAATQAQDLATAAGIGQAAAGLEFDYSALQSDENYRNRQQQLQALGMDRDEAFRQASQEFNQQFNLRQQELQALGMDRDQAYRQAALEWDQQVQATQLELQALGMDQDESYRYATLAQNKDYQDRVLQLQGIGLDRDEAYRYAALAQDKDYRDRVLELQAQGMDQDEAFRQAGFEYEQRERDQDQQFREDQARQNYITTLLSILPGLGIDEETAAQIVGQIRGEAGI